MGKGEQGVDKDSLHWEKKKRHSSLEVDGGNGFTTACVCLTLIRIKMIATGHCMLYIFFKPVEPDEVHKIHVPFPGPLRSV